MIPNINANNKQSYEAIREKNKSKVQSMYNKSYNTKDYLKIIDTFSHLLDNNKYTFNNMVLHHNKQSQTDSINKTKNEEYDTLYNKLEKIKSKNIERETRLMITKERNKNIEIYYTVYILFTFLLLVIEGSIILLK